MKKRRRDNSEASLSFLDVISCGFGAVVLLLIIAPLGEPAALEEAERELQGSVKELTERLMEIRGETVVLNDEFKSRKEQLSELTDRIARLRSDLASVEKQSDQMAQSRTVEEEQLRLALQVLTEEMERLQPRSEVSNQLIGGVPVDSEYVIFVIDTSGSMQMAAWPKVQLEMINILDIYPTVKGIQIMNDMGQYMFASYRGQWIPDSPDMRRRIITTLRNWSPFSNSSPVEGINAAIQSFYRPGRKISIYTLGDDFQGRSIRRVVKAVENLNETHEGSEGLVRIHAIGFPVHVPTGRTPSRSAIRFAALMRELSYNNGGTFIGLTTLRE
ncbi:MAG: VWA domain-containing protein [Pseudomonadota bacterium]